MKTRNNTLISATPQIVDYVYRFEGKDYTFKHNLVRLDFLAFWTKNPRTNLLNPPKSQDEFFEIFKNDKNVIDLQKKLREQHQLDPLVAKRISTNQYTVFEGNSRLAAMRLINEEIPLRFSEAKCYVAPDRCPDAVLEAIVDDRHGEDSPIRKWTPFGRGLHYVNLQKKYKSIRTVSEIVQQEAQEIQLMMKTSLTLISEVPKGQEPEKDRFSAVKAVHSHFQRKTTLGRKKVFDSLIRVALHQNYAGFGKATAFRDSIHQLAKASLSVLKNGIKEGNLPQILGKTKEEDGVAKGHKKNAVVKVKKERTPHFVRRIRNIHSDLTTFHKEILFSKRTEKNDSLRSSVHSYLVRIAGLASMIKEKLR